MRILIISDIHANLTAFDAVLEDAKGDWDYVWCLGDVVGLGPEPNECIDRLRELPHLCVAGDFDWAAIRRLDVRAFNSYDRHAAEWTQERLTDENISYLENLPITYVLNENTLVHASPRGPHSDYILAPIIAAWNFPHFETPYCLVGHSFQAAIFEKVNEKGDAIAHQLHYRQPFQLGKKRLIINPGSVGIRTYGQPFSAMYGILNLETYTIEHRKVPYDGEAVVDRGLLYGVISPNQPRQIALTWH